MWPTMLGHARTSAGHCVRCAQAVSAISSWIAPRETPLRLFGAGERGRLRHGEMTVLYIMQWQPCRWELLTSSREAPTDGKCNGDWDRLATKTWLRVTISLRIGTEAVRYCSVEGNATSSNGLTWALPSACHGSNPSPPSLLLCKAPASLALALDSTSRVHRALICIHESPVPKLLTESQSLFWTKFSVESLLVPTSAIGTTRWHSASPAPYTSSYRCGCFGRRKLQFFKTNLFPIEVACGGCKETVPGFLCFSH